MTKFDRRALLAGAGLLGVGGAMASAPAQAKKKSSALKASLFVKGATIYTSEPSQPVAEALAIFNDRILAVGDFDELEPLIGPNTEVIDARGAFVFPGFIDAHSHPAAIQQVYGVDVGFRSIAEIQQAMKQKASETPPGFWVDGFMYDDKKLTDGRPINRFDLDAAVPDHPAMVHHRGGHTAVVNSKALALAKITDATPDPAGGKFYREGGKLTGKLAETALDPFDKVGKRTEVTRAMEQEGVKRISKKMAAAGVTSVTNAWGVYDEMVSYIDARKAGDLGFRMCFMPHATTKVYPALKEAGLRTGFGDEMIRIGAVKCTVDGSASERTMRMSTPYQGRPNDFGILVMDQQQVTDAVNDARDAGFQIGMHANGDVAIRMVLNAYEEVLREKPLADPRYRIEHCTLVDPDILKRIKAIGAIPTPFYTYAHYHGDKWGEYGEEKLEWMFAHRSFLDFSIPVAPASDYPPGPFEPLMAIQSMVTRKDLDGKVWGPSQRISVDEAIRICTVNGAYASFEEGLKGSLAPGKLADFTILARDPHTDNPDQIEAIPVVRTVLGGRTTYEA
ncbi:MAG TPA: amidohydrolase [Amphiplicatus sp.]|nr:amidohydrolase [Amphiplicatus sp.]